MARVMTGTQSRFRNQTTIEAVSRAKTNCTTRTRPKVAPVNAAMPFGVRGCHAKGRFEAGAEGAPGATRLDWVGLGWTGFNWSDGSEWSDCLSAFTTQPG